MRCDRCPPPLFYCKIPSSFSFLVFGDDGVKVVLIVFIFLLEKKEVAVCDFKQSLPFYKG